MQIEEMQFGVVPGGSEVTLYKLKNTQGMEVHVINYGAIITSVLVPDREGRTGDTVLGFDDLGGYLGDHPYIGAMVGRVCNRISGASFELDGKVYRLPANENGNHLHGGLEGFDRKIWNASAGRSDESVRVRLDYLSADGEEGYPGNLKAEVTYSLNDRNELGISCKATTDRKTHVNLTNHSYFNLGSHRNSILGHELWIDGGHITELDGESIPTGRILPVDGTPYDFRKPAGIGQRISQVKPGYDINYVLHSGPRERTRVASLYHPESGRRMEVLTTLPGIQLYTSNFLDVPHGKGGTAYGTHSAVCLETQFFPDAPNNPSFPSTLLLPGDLYSAETIYRFTA